MKLDVFFTPHAVTERDVHGRLVVAIDVLRACSTIVTALSNGARSIVPVSDMEAAGRLTAGLAGEGNLLGGERNGTKIDGFDLGNSPAEYTRDTVEGRTIIFKTTNGTDALLKGLGAKILVAGCFLNAGAVADLARESDLDVTLICSGWRGQVSYEDTLCAGLIADRVVGRRAVSSAPDTVRMATQLYRSAAKDILAAMTHSDHGQRLAELGAADDVSTCSRIDAVPVLPTFRDQHLVLLTRPNEIAAGQ